jgi:hypothetical protein
MEMVMETLREIDFNWHQEEDQEMADNIPTFPVTGVNIRSVESEGLLLLQLSFRAHSMQKMEEADPGRNYALTIEQAEELRDMLDRTIQKVKSSAPPKSQSRHH